MLVVRQPDGTLAQIPAWMCAPAAAAMAVRERPRIALTALRDLRLALDAALSSLSDTIGGERHGASADRTTRRFPGLMEPGPTLAPAMRARLIPLMAALLLEAAEAELRIEAGEREAGDEQDRA